MHLNGATLQMIIAQNNRNRFEIWKYGKHLGRFELARVSGSQEERLIDDRISQQSGQHCVQTTICR